MTLNLFRIPSVNALSQLKSILITQIRSSVISNYQFQPAPYPKTEAERLAAAEKYGLHPDEYFPYPEEEGYGDYPKLPDIGADSKDVHYPYDDPAFKRNFREPVHAFAEMFGEDRVDPALRPRYPLWIQWLSFLGVVGGGLALFFYFEDYKCGRPVVAKQYPSQGPHYFFYPADKC